MRRITKTFGPVVALRDVGFTDDEVTRLAGIVRAHIQTMGLWGEEHPA